MAFPQYILFRALAGFLRILPYGTVLGIGRLLGQFGYLVLKKRRKIAIENISNAFPEMMDAQAKKLARGCFVHLGLVVVEILSIPRLAARPDFADRIEQRGTDKLKPLREKHGGLILVSGHIGNWEIGGVASAANGIPLASVVRRLDNPYLDRYLRRFRESTGQRIIEKDGAFLAIARGMREGFIPMILIDQNAGSDGLGVEFFGRTASTTPFAAALAVKKNWPLVVSYSQRLDGGKRHALVIDSVLSDELAGGTDEEKVYELTRLATARLEAVIRKIPEQWLWVHRRWKNPGRSPGKGEVGPDTRYSTKEEKKSHLNGE